VKYVNEFRAAFGNVARDERVAFVPFLLEGLDKREQFQADALHPAPGRSRYFWRTCGGSSVGWWSCRLSDREQRCARAHRPDATSEREALAAKFLDHALFHRGRASDQQAPLVCGSLMKLLFQSGESAGMRTSCP